MIYVCHIIVTLRVSSPLREGRPRTEAVRFQHRCRNLRLSRDAASSSRRARAREPDNSSLNLLHYSPLLKKPCVRQLGAVMYVRSKPKRSPYFDHNPYHISNTYQSKSALLLGLRFRLAARGEDELSRHQIGG